MTPAAETPESAEAEDEREDGDHLHGDQRPDKEELSIRVSDPSAGKTFSHHVHHRHAGAENGSKKHDDVTRSPPAEHDRSVEQCDHHKHPNDGFWPTRFEPAGDVVSQVKCHENDREQGSDG